MIDTLRQLVSNKKVLLLGFGREGKSTYNALKKAGGYKEIAIADKNNITPPDDCIRVFYGESYQAACKDYDVVFKSPGIVLDSEVLSYDCEITCQTNVFLEKFSQQIIGITGTKGKSTTTTLLYHILSNSGVKSVMCGNIGIPCFDKAEEIDEDTKIVFEFSCHQLEYAKKSPHISVLINLYEEHLDHYGTIENYFEAKKKIYRFQNENDLLLCGVQCDEMLDGVKSKKLTITGGNEDADIRVNHGVVNYKNHSLTIPLDEIHLIGEHNFFNIGTVYGISKELGVSDEAFINALKSYTPPAHRLEFCGIYDGISYYDDSISTICETCINAIRAVPKIATVLIGGMDRGIDYSPLIEFLTHNPDAVMNVIFMADSGKRVYEEISAKGMLCDRFKLVNTLDEAVSLSKKITPKGMACVMSPAAASYGIFRDFEERGEKFKELIAK